MSGDIDSPVIPHCQEDRGQASGPGLPSLTFNLSSDSNTATTSDCFMFFPSQPHLCKCCFLPLGCIFPFAWKTFYFKTLPRCQPSVKLSLTPSSRIQVAPLLCSYSNLYRIFFSVFLWNLCLAHKSIYLSNITFSQAPTLPPLPRFYLLPGLL